MVDDFSVWKTLFSIRNYFLVFSLFVSVHVRAQDENITRCPEAAAAYLDNAIQSAAPESGKTLIFNDDVIAYFKMQRAFVKQVFTHWGGKFYEMDHVYRHLVLPRMLRTHALLMGPSGAGKSAIVREFVNALIPQRDGSLIPNSFALQLNPLTSDAELRGYVDPEALKTREGREKARAEMDAKIEGDLKKAADSGGDFQDFVNNQGTLIWFTIALLDELDKGNPRALSAVLDILNEKIAQYGPFQVPVRLESLYSTVNSNLQELLESFREQNMEELGRALLNRIPFKTYVSNWINSDDLRARAQMGAWERSRSQALLRLTQPGARFLDPSQVTGTQITSPLPAVDWVWLGDIAKASSIVTPTANVLVSEITKKIREDMNNRAFTSESDHLKDKRRSPYFFVPPNEVSNRLFLELNIDTISASLMLDLMLSPVSDDWLLGQIQGGIPLDRYTTWRMQDLYLTAAPGIPLPSVDANGNLAVVYGPELDQLAQNPLNARDDRIFSDLQECREFFSAMIQTALSDIDSEEERGTENLIEAAQLLGVSESEIQIRGKPSMEKLLMAINPRAHSAIQP